jgi:hypothetical protein
LLEKTGLKWANAYGTKNDLHGDKQEERLRWEVALVSLALQPMISEQRANQGYRIPTIEAGVSQVGDDPTVSRGTPRTARFGTLAPVARREFQM